MRLFSCTSLAEDEVIMRRRGQVIAMGSIATLPCMVGSLGEADEIYLHAGGIAPFRQWRLRMGRERIDAEKAAIRAEWADRRLEAAASSPTEECLMRLQLYAMREVGRGNVVVTEDDVPVAMGRLSDLQCVDDGSYAETNWIYVHPDEAEFGCAWLFVEGSA